MSEKTREDGAKGGGNIAYIRDGLPFRIRHDLNNDNNECLWFEIVRQKCKPILICSVYKVPDAVMPILKVLYHLWRILY